MVKPPPEKKIKLEDNGSAVSTSTSLVSKEVGVADTVEDDDVIPKIKSSHLNLDDIPMELLPTHQEKIMKQVLNQIKTGLTTILGTPLIRTPFGQMKVS